MESFFPRIEDEFSFLLSWESQNLLVPLGTTRFLQGTLLAKIQDLGFEDQQKAYADILTNEAIEMLLARGHGEQTPVSLLRSHFPF